MIKNIEELATTEARGEALAILEAGYNSLDTTKVIKTNVKIRGQWLKLGGKLLRLSPRTRIFVIGIGKCSFTAAKALEEILGEKITAGVVIDVVGGPLQRLRSYVGTHPFPTEANAEATRAAVDLVKGLTKRDLVITIISGGGSALFCYPYKMSVAELGQVTKALMLAGASIQEMNTVRKHLSEVQGGQLAKLVYPARLVSLIFSDVPGDNLNFIASGPTVLDKTTVKDAEEIVMRYNVLQSLGLNKLNFKESPKNRKYFRKVKNIIVVSNKTALTAMKIQAKKIGYRVRVLGHDLQITATELAPLFFNKLKPGLVILGAGETTVTISGPAKKGGRNQEAVLAALKKIPEGGIFISAASDGEDNSDMAGAVGDYESKSRATSRGLDISQVLAEHASYDFFSTTKDHIFTGKTGANVSDLFIALQKKV
jgi:glycerate 2-kinase